MQTTKNWGWLGQGLAILSLSATLAACGGSSDADSTAPASTASSQGASPSVSGTPPTTVAADNHYRFRPTVALSATDEPVSFSIQNKPSWASFSITSGQLSGTPATSSVGTDSDIIITVSDGTLSASLAAFSIKVAAAVVTPTVGSATLKWVAPTKNTNGTAPAATPQGSPVK